MEHGLYTTLIVSVKEDEVADLEQRLPGRYIGEIVKFDLGTRKDRKYTFNEPLTQGQMIDLLNCLYSIPSPRFEFRADMKKDIDTGKTTRFLG